MKTLRYALFDCLPMVHNFPAEAVVSTRGVTASGETQFDGKTFFPDSIECMQDYFLNKILEDGEHLKYIASGGYFALFHGGITHKMVFSFRKIDSAGFCQLVNGKFVTFGESVSLKVKSSPVAADLINSAMGL